MRYGKCPKCGANGYMRERRPNGNDTCINYHTYPSKDAVVACPGCKQNFDSGLKAICVECYEGLIKFKGEENEIFTR
jgi:ssDNA-binding Zn-finger/Zn-ribbon topoisomerase 1